MCKILTKNKTPKRSYQVRTYLKHDFGLAEPEENSRYGLGQKIPYPRNGDDHVLSNVAGTAAANLA